MVKFRKGKGGENKVFGEDLGVRSYFKIKYQKEEGLWLRK
jgi:hypothetical protein